MLKKFVHYVFLNIISMLALSFYIIIDTLFIANVCGSSGVAALNISLPGYGFIYGLGLMLGVGSATRFRIFYNDYDKKCAFFTKALFFASIISILFVIIGLFFSEPILRLLGASDTVMPFAFPYFKYMLIFTPAFIFNDILLSFIRNDSNPGLVSSAVMLSSFANVFLDYIFMFIFKWGMFGAVVATGISPILSMMLLSVHFLQHKNTFKFKLSSLKLIKFTDFFYQSALGISSLISEVSSSIVIIIYNFILLKYVGDIGVAAYGVIANISLVIIAVFRGISDGIQPLVSECYVKHDYKNIWFIIKLAIALALILMSLTYLYFTLFPTTVTNLFNPTRDLKFEKIAIDGMLIYFIGSFFASINLIVSVVSQAIAKPRPAFIISMLRGIILIVIFALVFSYFWQVRGMWASYVVTELVVAIFSLFSLSNIMENEFIN